MKKLNINKLSTKQINKITQKAAFSHFVDSLKKSNDDELWECCNIEFSSLKQLHKHVSCNHVNNIDQSCMILKEISKCDEQKTINSELLFPKFLGEFHCVCSANNSVVILFYHYVEIKCDLHMLKTWQEELCQKLSLKGKIRIATEGINGTLEGCQCAIDAYKDAVLKVDLFKNVLPEDFKSSVGTGRSFEGLFVSVCAELCTIGISPSKLSHSDGGVHLTPEEFHTALTEIQHLKENRQNAKNFPLLLDCRNFYESKIGYFADAVMPDLRKFSYFPEYVDRNSDLFEGRDVLTYCTGGIRCERASAYIKKATNCSKVYQLQGGIHKYLEKYPDGYFKGRLFVFDNRYSIGPTGGEITSDCIYCANPHDEYRLCGGSTCRQLVLICQDCRRKGKLYCCELCKANFEADITTEQCKCTMRRNRIPKEETPS